jgi:hypothetical protein
MRIFIAAAALAAAVPVAAQPEARPAACRVEASAAAGSELTRYGCAGTRKDDAVRFSVSLPAGWQVAVADTSGLELAAWQADAQIIVVGGDQLSLPLTRADTLAFWTLAAGKMLGHAATREEVETFRDAANGRIAAARDRLTGRQLWDDALLDMAEELSAAGTGYEVARQEREVRTLAGEPAGYISEVLREGDREMLAISYVTVRDAAFFFVTLNVPAEQYPFILPLWERVLDSFDPRTERW